MTDGDDVTTVLDTKEEFPANETYVQVVAYNVPSSERYPEGVKYSYQYGDTDGNTIIRYDNFPDHPGASHHHKHCADGSVIDVEFPVLLDLYDRFKQEVQDNGEPWH